MNDGFREYLHHVAEAIGAGSKRKSSSIDAAIETTAKAVVYALAHPEASGNVVARETHRRRSWCTKAVSALRRAQASVDPANSSLTPGTRVPSPYAAVENESADAQNAETS